MCALTVRNVAGMHVAMLLDARTSFTSVVDVMYMMK